MQRRKLLSFLLKTAFTAVALGYAGWRIWKDRNDFAYALDHLSDTHLPFLFLSLFLVTANLGVETLKWRLLVKPVYPSLSFGRAVKAVLAGMATGLVTPNRIGEYAGRVLLLEPGKRWEAVSLTFIDRLCQMLITLLMGGVALNIYHGQAQTPQWVSALVLLAPAIITVCFLLFSERAGRWLVGKNFRAVWLSKMVAPIQYLRRVMLLQVLALSLLRYLIFTSQYVLLLYAFSAEPPGLDTCIQFVLLVFLGKSVLPVFSGLGELGVRESLALVWAGILGISDPVALQATFLLFVINILLPALAGIPFVQGMSIRKEDA